MLLSEPPESPYDVNFQLFGFPIRVTWTFWLAGLIFGYNGALAIDQVFVTDGGLLPWLAMWVAVVFISILVHELGHAIAFRICGIEASVVLYHFGGLAIPSSSGFSPVGGTSRRRGQLGPWEQIFISAAGPLAQLILAVFMLICVRLAGYGLWGGPPDLLNAVSLLPSFIGQVDWLMDGELVQEPGLFALLYFGFFVNIFWPLLNLIPVWPLDGGQIAREVIMLLGGTMLQAMKLSFAVGAIVACYFFLEENFFAGILFASLAASSYQMMTMMDSWR